MKIIFILPGPNQNPIGGYRVVYDYADRLAERGHQVTILFSLAEPFLYKPPLWFRHMVCRLQKGFSPKWFIFKNQVELKVIPEVTDQYVPDGDAIFATWWASAYLLHDLSKTKGEKYYLIQHYETWAGNQKLLHKTYRLKLKNIVIADWLKSKLESLGAQVAAHIPNGINLGHFRLMVPIEERKKNSIIMMYHQANWKGSRDGLKALELVREKFPDVSLTFFSVYSKPSWIPGWVKYIKRPSQELLVNLYNNHAIFISPSWAEGWPLPPAESMACGCALVSTDIGGVKDYALHNETALLSPPKNPEALADNIIRLLNDNTLRIKLAQKGNAFIQNFGWEIAVNKMESLLKNQKT